MITLSSWLPFGVIQDLGWTLIHFVWQGAALALLLAAALPASRSAQERYQAAFVTLVFMLAAPVITFIVLRNHAPQAFGLPGDLWRYVTDVSATVPWLSWIVTMWLAGVVIFCARAAGGLYVVYSLRRRGVCALPPAVARRCADLAQRAGLHAAVVFLQSSIANVPLVMGCLRPIVLLPVAVVMRLPLHQLEALVLHELAHIRRRDALANLFQIVVETLLFYHPAVWWVSNRVRHERENCCDDAAVALSGDAVSYARALTALEEIRPASAFALAATGGALRRRILRLFHAPTQGQRFPLFATIIGLLCVGGYIALPPTTAAITTLSSDRAVEIRVISPSDLGAFTPPALILPEVTLAAQPRAVRETKSTADVPDVNKSYVYDIRSLLPDIRTTQIVALNTYKVTPDDIRATQSVWPSISPAEILALRAVDLHPTDVADFQHAGLDTREVSPLALVIYKRQGVSPALVRALQSVGVTQIRPTDYLTAQAHGLTLEFLTTVRNHNFHGLSMQGLLALKRVGAFG